MRSYLPSRHHHRCYRYMVDLMSPEPSHFKAFLKKFALSEVKKLKKRWFEISSVANLEKRIF